MDAASVLANARQAGASIADGLYAIGFAMMDGGRWNDAADVFRAMVLLCPRDERSWLALGRCHEELEQHAIATELYSLGMLSVPGTIRCRVALARLLRADGRDDYASEVLEAAMEIACGADDETMMTTIRREMMAS